MWHVCEFYECIEWSLCIMINVSQLLQPLDMTILCFSLVIGSVDNIMIACYLQNYKIICKASKKITITSSLVH